MNILSAILVHHTNYGPLQNLALASINSLVTNCNVNAIKICGTFKGNEYAPTLIDVIISRLSQASGDITVFRGLVDFMCSIFVHKVARSIVVKVFSGFCLLINQRNRRDFWANYAKPFSLS